MPSPRMPPLRAVLALLVGVAVVVAASAVWMAHHMQSIDQLTMPRLAQVEHAQPAPSPAPAAKPEPSPVKPSFDIVRVSPDGRAVLAGRAAPGAEVVVQQGKQELGRAKADASGDWVMLPDAPLAPGARELTLSEKPPQGPEVKADGSVMLVVPQPQEQAQAQAPSSTQASAGPSQPPLAVLTQGDQPPRVLQGPSAAPSGPPHLQLGTVDYGNSGEVRFAGRAAPGSTVRVYVDKHPVGDAKAEPNGSWTLTPPSDVVPGQHELRLDQLSAKGAVGARVELPFTRARLGPQELALGSVIVQPGQSLWLIARHSYGQGIRYTVIYRANQGQIRDPNLIYPGQVFAIPAADAESNAPTPSSRSR